MQLSYHIQSQKPSLNSATSNTTTSTTTTPSTNNTSFSTSTNNNSTAQTVKKPLIVGNNNSNYSLSSSAAYTSLPVSFERSLPVNFDGNSFYPPLAVSVGNSTSNNTTYSSNNNNNNNSYNMNKTSSANNSSSSNTNSGPSNSNAKLSLYVNTNSPSTLKKQEQEIKSQLSPSFWARLNEATKSLNPSYTYDTYINSLYNNRSTPTKTAPPPSIYSTHSKIIQDINNPGSSSFSNANVNGRTISTQIPRTTQYAQIQPSASSNQLNALTPRGTTVVLERKPVLKPQEVRTPERQVQKPLDQERSGVGGETFASSVNKARPTLSANSITVNRTLTNPIEYKPTAGVQLKPASYEKSHTFAERPTTAFDYAGKRYIVTTKTADENVSPDYAKYSPKSTSTTIVPSSNRSTPPSLGNSQSISKSQKNLPSLTMLPQASPSRPILVVNNSTNKSSGSPSFQISLSSSRDKINSDELPRRAAQSLSGTSLSRTLPTSSDVIRKPLISTQNTQTDKPAIQTDYFRRSKTMTPGDRNRVIKYMAANNAPTTTISTTGTTSSSSGNSSNTLPSNGSSTTSSSNNSSNLRNLHKSLSIRSRINNFYKDFHDEKNNYISNLKLDTRNDMRNEANVSLDDDLNNENDPFTNLIDKIVETILPSASNGTIYTYLALNSNNNSFNVIIRVWDCGF